MSLQENYVPLNNYYAIKLARYYMDIYFPKFNFENYEFACIQAENYLNVNKMQKGIILF